ncbi:MAG: KH domain-containing protein [Candidatus Nanoarchaeia archaeon]|nr:KH domain-containing protein [Candidatus Nanoarchaeia archaeon]
MKAKKAVKKEVKAVKVKAPAKKAAVTKKAAKAPLTSKPSKQLTAMPSPEIFRQELKIPKDRVGVLVGTKGAVKRHIEKTANVKLDISHEGDVVISGRDTVMLYDVKIVIQAIGRGFSPAIAFQLFNESAAFELLDITDYAGKSKKKMDRLRGRVIGENGRARRSVEDLTETAISVYGKTVGIIGDMEMAALAREAVDMLLSGAPHGAVYRMLENKRREIHRHRLEAMGRIR